MRVLWLCNVVLPEIEKEFGFKPTSYGGWLTGMWDELVQNQDIELAICVPIRNPSRLRDGVLKDYKYYSFLTISSESDSTIKNQVDRFKNILDDFNPDVIHIWGSEFEHSYSMILACKEKELLNRTIINIQGLVTYCSKDFSIGLSKEELMTYYKGRCINDHLQEVERKSITEQKLFEDVQNCIGRTDWDRACSKDLNPGIKYYYCGEILRNGFYTAKKWNGNSCQKHTIFLSQVSYPIKGFHLVIEELRRLKDDYPDLLIRIAGINISELYEPYHKVIMDKIRKYDMENTVLFLGELDEEEILKEYQKANVFLSSSIIENSPNSVCEAMMIGTPVVASDVGGISSIIKHNVNGFTYPLLEPYMMRFYIKKIFEEDGIASNISKNAIKNAERFNDKKEITKRMTDIYFEIADN